MRTKPTPNQTFSKSGLDSLLHTGKNAITLKENLEGISNYMFFSWCEFGAEFKHSCGRNLQNK